MMMSGVSSFCDILNVKVVGDPDWRQRFVVLSNSTLWIYGDDQDPRRTKIHPVRDLAASRRVCDGSQLVLHIKNIAKMDWFKVKFTSEKHLNAWKKRIRQVREAWNEETYLQYLDQKSQLRCPYEPLTRLNRQVPSTKHTKPRLPFSRSRSLQEIISWEKLPITLTQVNKEVLCGANDLEAILIKARINIVENEMVYNKEMNKMLAAFKKRALWPDYFLMDDKSLIEQTLCKLKESSDTLLHDVEDMWPTCSMVLDRLDDLALLLVGHLKSVARTRMITFCHLLRDFRPFLRNNLESVDDIYSDVYSEYFYIERALLPIFRVYKLKGISKKLAVMLAASNNPNGERWNELFGLCNETLKETYAELSRLFGDHYPLSVTQLFAFSDKHAAFERNGDMSLFEKFELAKEISEISDSVVPLIKVVIVEGGKCRDSAAMAGATDGEGYGGGAGEKRWSVDDDDGQLFYLGDGGGRRTAADAVGQPVTAVKNPFAAFMDDDVDDRRPEGRKRRISVTKSYELKVYSSSVSYFRENSCDAVDVRQLRTGFSVGSRSGSFREAPMRTPQMVA